MKSLRLFLALPLAGLSAAGNAELRSADLTRRRAPFAAQDVANASPEGCVLFDDGSSIRQWR